MPIPLDLHVQEGMLSGRELPSVLGLTKSYRLVTVASHIRAPDVTSDDERITLEWKDGRRTQL